MKTSDDREPADVPFGRDRLLVLLLCRAGLRRSEAVGLRREDIHFLVSGDYRGSRAAPQGSGLGNKQQTTHNDGAQRTPAAARQASPPVLPTADA